MTLPSTLFAVVGLVAVAMADETHEGHDHDSMHMDPPKEFHPVNPGSKSFHWILSLALLLMVPSVSAVAAVANKVHWSLLLQVVLTAYLVFELLFLDFPDSNNHENRTSKGTLWFLSMLLGATIFLGTFINGSNVVINKFYPHLKTNEYGWSYKLYKVLSVLSVVTGWVRVCLAPVALFGFCTGKHTGQCIAHGIMGSSFVFYGLVLAIVLVVPWIRNHNQHGAPGRSQEFWDSSLMCAWGIVNTFTEHRWGKEGWSHGDYQHTSMGIIWWCGGLLGMWLTRNNGVRLFVPALLLIFTGYAMLEHAQKLVISTKVHALFGLVLISAGVCRVIEILVLLGDAAAAASGKVLSFQHIPPFCLVLAGVLFMAANEEQLILVKDLGADHSSYIMVVSGAAFVIYLWILMMMALYLRLVGYDENGELDGYRGVSEHFELSELEEETP